MNHDILQRVMAQKIHSVLIFGLYTEDLKNRFGESLKHYILDTENGDDEYYCLLDHFVRKVS